MEDIGGLLRRRRKELGYTQEEVAAHLERSPRLIGEIERGRGSVGLSKVLEYAHGLGIDFVLEVRGK
ncbi:MAG: helix-turn-helix domain-containing protein [Coriobacteriales bacterium]|nr:helix-turn-helix domain-containing protein [Coriobacteriales bacterium]